MFRLRNTQYAIRTIRIRVSRYLLWVGLLALLIGLIIGFPAIWAGLAWLDRLFYPYTAVIITGFSLVILLLIMLGAVMLSQPDEQAEIEAKALPSTRTEL